MSSNEKEKVDLILLYFHRGPLRGNDLLTSSQDSSPSPFSSMVTYRFLSCSSSSSSSSSYVNGKGMKGK